VQCIAFPCEITRWKPRPCAEPGLRHFTASLSKLSYYRVAAVLATFPTIGYRRPMSDADDELVPADPRDLVISVAMALTSDSRLAKAQAAEAMANVVAERIVERLQRDGFVVSRRPPAGGHPALGRGFEG
jgi:hypothetical protein